MVKFLLTSEYQDLQHPDIFLNTAVTSPLTSDINIETAKDNKASWNCCLKQPVVQSIIALFTVPAQEELKKSEK